MASAKRTPAKKAPVKRVAAEKAAPAKKAAAVPAKRAYNRKPKVAEAVVADVAGLMDAISKDAEIATANGIGGESPRPQLEGIDVIDLREMPIVARFQVAYLLAQQGYVWTHALEKDLLDGVASYMYTEAIVLNQANKLATTMRFEDLKKGLAIAQPVTGSLDSTVVFSEPCQAAPDQVVIAGVLYNKA